jgi:hypothetical protein
MDRNVRIGIAVVSACVLLCAGVASAQTKPAQQGPLVLQPTGDGPVMAPEVTFGDFDGKYGTLVGGYGGWVVDNRLLLGAGVNFLVDHGYHDPVAGMGYGGFIAGYTVGAGKGIQVGIRGLIGFGEASLNDSFSYPVPMYYPEHHHDVVVPPDGMTLVQQVHFHDGFFIFEPQATAVVRVGHGFAIDVAGGYRVIAGTYYNNRLQGPSLSIGVRFGPKI